MTRASSPHLPSPQPPSARSRHRTGTPAAWRHRASSRRSLPGTCSAGAGNSGAAGAGAGQGEADLHRTPGRTLQKQDQVPRPRTRSGSIAPCVGRSPAVGRRTSPSLQPTCGHTPVLSSSDSMASHSSKMGIFLRKIRTCGCARAPGTEQAGPGKPLVYAGGSAWGTRAGDGRDNRCGGSAGERGASLHHPGRLGGRLTYLCSRMDANAQERRPAAGITRGNAAPASADSTPRSPPCQVRSRGTIWQRSVVGEGGDLENAAEMSAWFPLTRGAAGSTSGDPGVQLSPSSSSEAGEVLQFSSPRRISSARFIGCLG